MILKLQQMNEIKINKMSLSRIDSLVITDFKELEFLENRLKNNEMLKKKMLYINYCIEHLEMEMILKHFINVVIILWELYQLLKQQKG